MGDGGAPGPGWGVEGTRPGAEKGSPSRVVKNEQNGPRGVPGGPLGGPRGGLCGPLGGL